MSHGHQPATPPFEMPWRSQRALARTLAGRGLTFTVEGLEHIPARGPALLVARHYHHLYDGVAMLITVPRPLRVLVAADWAQGPGRQALAALCRAAAWPMVLRPRANVPVEPAAQRRQLRQAMTESVALLRRGDVLLIFPEGYPVVDPHVSPRAPGQDWLPFASGFARIARLAEANGGPPVPIVPVGLEYTAGDRWSLQLRYGAPLWRRDFVDIAALVAATEGAVRQLSGDPAAVDTDDPAVVPI